MTEVFFVRHSISDLSIKDNLLRPLTDGGIEKACELIKLFENIYVDDIFSSPYKRAIQTIEPISNTKNICIKIVNDFREMKISDNWVNNYNEYIKKWWDDFSYKIDNGESLFETQYRNIQALEKILIEYKNKTVIIGTHGTALSTIINYYDNVFQYQEFMEIINVMPYVIKMKFDEIEYRGKEEIKIPKTKTST
jgi:2,3-bisphosphoglycerate-dependent phosphoglycerate mutase